MSMFLIIYLISVILMLTFYWIDRDNTKYRDITYSDLLICFASSFLPVVNTSFAALCLWMFIYEAEFWSKTAIKGKQRPEKKLYFDNEGY